MTLLRWRPWSRAALISRLNEMPGLAVSTGEPEAAHEQQRREAQQIEDARLAVPLDAAPRRSSPIHTHRRHLDSTVWHGSSQCPAWPQEPPHMEQLGEPL